MRKFLFVATATLALAACNKPAEEAAPAVTEEVPVETPAADTTGAMADDAATTDDAMKTDDGKAEDDVADEKGVGDERGGAGDER